MTMNEQPDQHLPTGGLVNADAVELDPPPLVPGPFDHGNDQTGGLVAEPVAGAYGYVPYEPATADPSLTWVNVPPYGTEADRLAAQQTPVRPKSAFLTRKFLLRAAAIAIFVLAPLVLILVVGYVSNSAFIVVLLIVLFVWRLSSSDKRR